MMAELSYPGWVTDDSNPPAPGRVPAKKALWLFVACEKLRLLHNGVWKWARAQALSSAEDAVLSEEFGSGAWPLTYPDDRPTEEQAETWLADHWEPRQHAAQAERARLRGAIPEGWFAYVDLGNILA
ncbi:MAG: hypothetical protein PVH68_04745 [Armatimonadota bacterium]|jgi:hypothetical protein